MALITCPECNREISDKAISCPHCGYILTSGGAKASETPSTRTPRPTRIGEQQKNLLSGSVGTIGGMALIVVGILLLFVLLPIGIILIVAGAIVLTKGNAAAVGTHDVICPYCGSSGKVESPATSYRCPTCGKKSVKRDGYLHPIL